MLKKSQLYFFFTLLILIGALALFIALPYLQAIVLAGALAVICYHPYQWLVRKLKYESLAAALMIVLVILILFVPISLVGIQAFREVTNLYDFVSTYNLQELQNTPFVARFLERFSPETLNQPQDALKGMLDWLVSSAGYFFASTLTIFLNVVLCIFALFYFLKDGKHLREWLIDFTPLPAKYDVMILGRLTNTVTSVIRGYLVVGMVHGIAAGIGLTIFGVPNATLWGIVVAIAALVPAVGATTVYVPSIAYLFLQGHPGAAVGLWVWWLFMIMLIDNILTPKLVSRGARIHPFAVFVAVIGGISFFGPIGFLIGPLVFSLFFALLDIYVEFHREETDGPAKPPARPARARKIARAK
jgi:predicted PurR-regulated permease PerM